MRDEFNDMENYGSDNESFYTCVDNVNIKTINELENKVRCIRTEIDNNIMNTEELKMAERQIKFINDSIKKKYIVKNKFPNIYSNIDKILTDKSTGLIYGELQTNKTATTIALCLELLANDYIPLVFCQDVDAINSLQMKIMSFEKNYNVFVPMCKMGDIKIEEGSLTKHAELIENLNVTNPYPPKMYISLAHNVQFRKTEQLVRLARKEFDIYGTRKIAVILDEAHKTMYSGVVKKCRKSDNLEPEKYDKKPSIEDSIERLFEMADNVIGVSATPQRLLLEGIYKRGIDYIIKVPTPEKYVSFENLNYIEIKEKDEKTKPSEDEELIDFYTNKINEPLTRTEYPALDYERKPQLTLIKVTTDTKEQSILFDNITTLNKHTCIEKNSYKCTISVTSTFAGKIKDSSLKIGKHTYKLTDYRFFHLKTETHIQEILNSFLEYIDSIENIIVIGSKMTNMGVSICSKGGEIRINNQFLRLATDTPADSAEQQNRQNGRINCPQPVNIYATKTDYLNINKGYKLKKDIVETFENALLERDVGKIAFKDSINFFKNTNVNKDKIPQNKFFGGKKGNVRRSRVFKKIVKEEDGLLYSVKDYIESVRNSMNIDMTEIAKECAKIGYSDEFERLTKKMFPVWSNPSKDTRIARFMKNLDPYKLYTVEELKEHALCIGMKTFGITHFVDTNRGTNGFGNILQKVDSKYKLRDELLEKYLEYFN